MKLLHVILLVIINSFFTHSAFAQHINAYARVTAINTGTRVITLSGTAAERNYTAHTFVVGDKVFLMQMQDSVIGTNTGNNANFGDLANIRNVGKFEVSTITAVSGNPVTSITVDVINNSYNINGRARVQAISLRSFAGNYTTTANITALRWDGNIGGVVAIEVEGTLTLAHNITADSSGFRGGAQSDNAGSGTCAAGEISEYRSNQTTFGYKGEGIFRITDDQQRNRRGKILTGGGGGNDHNAGGGGGGNYSAGGNGGNGWGGGNPAGNGYCLHASGGIGGISLAHVIAPDRLFLGGGGGGGEQNDGQATKGGDGGGAIFIQANTIQTTGSCAGRIISANGQNASPTSGEDGGGGGGAGGTIVFNVDNWNINSDCELLISSNGSNGSSVTHADAHGGGGGGGQGIIFFNTEIPTTNITSTTLNGMPGCNDNSCSSRAGEASDTNNAGIFGFISTPLPIDLLFYRATKLSQEMAMIDWATSAELNNSYFTVYKSLDGENWTELGSIQGNGNSDQYHSYELYDYNLKAGLNYYKLIQTDFDGKIKEHGIRIIESGIPQNQVIIQPNPSDGVINLQFSAMVTGGKIEILNTLGQILVAESFFSYESSISLPEISGIYLIRITFNGQVQTHKVVRN